MHIYKKRLIALLTAFTALAGTIPGSITSAETYKDSYFGLEGTAIADTGSRILVDLNANDGRKASYKKSADNWCVAGGSSASVTFNGVTFKLSNGGSAGGDTAA